MNDLYPLFTQLACLITDLYGFLKIIFESQEDVELIRLWENQKLSLENILRKQRAAMKHMHKILADAENIHKKMATELEDEKEKNASMKGKAC